MVKITARIDARDFTRRIKRFPSNLTPTLQEAVRRDAKFFIKEIIKITPPFSESVKTAGAAKKAGEKKLERDIRRVYASASFAYGTIQNPAAAAAFWFTIKGRGKNKNLKHAQDILRENSYNAKIRNANVVQEMDLRLHQAARKNGVVRKVDVKEIIVKESALTKYIRESKNLIGGLAGGWAAAAEKLNVPVPSWVKRHKKNGSIARFMKGKSPNVIIKNDSKYATNADMTRRVNWVLKMEKRKKATELFVRHDLRARWKREFGH